MTLKELQQEVAIWADKNFKYRERHQQLLGVIEEVGELAHAHLKNEQRIRGQEDILKTAADKIDAIGDIVIYLADYCNTNDLNLSACVDSTWSIVKQRDWIKYPTDGRTK